MADNRNVPMRKIIDEIIERYDFDEGLVDRTLIVKKNQETLFERTHHSKRSNF